MAEPADDIDDLLDEVETKFLARDGQNKRMRPRPRSTSMPTHMKRSTSSSESTETTESEIGGRFRHPRAQDSVGELENAIEELCSLPPDVNEILPKRPSSGLPTIGSESPLRKCFVTYLGGTQISAGLSTSFIQRPCSNLQCTTCDFKVAIFDHYAWDDSTEHLFLRNNMPDFDRLKAKLHTQRGWCAYACQCHCTSMGALVELRKHEILKWVCAGH